MRSEQVFAAMGKVVNRYMLCTLTSKTMRGFVKPRLASPKVINDVLEMIGNGREMRMEPFAESRNIKSRKV